MHLLTLDIDSTESARRAALAAPARALRDGLLVVFPTETVYGLGAHALDPDAVARVFAVKGRPANDPLIVHVLTEWPLESVFATPTALLQRLVDAFWPGPLTLVAPRSSAILDAVTSGSPLVAVRAPAHPVARCLLELSGVPVAAPSANRFGFVSPTTVDHVLADIGPQCDWVIDGGPTQHGIESTVLSLGADERSVRILRHGAITAEQLAPFATVVDAGGPAAARSATAPATTDPTTAAPGQAVRHYAPRTRTIAVEPDAATAALLDRIGAQTAVYLGYDDRPRPPGWRGEWRTLGSTDDLEGVAHRLYAALHDIDDSGYDLIAVELTACPGLGRAIDDRLRRSANGSVWA
jgi:L-threonylcarbamoyladenylate synthase